MQLPNIYSKKNYKIVLAIPMALFVVFFFLIFAWPTVPKGIDLAGGTLVIIRSDKPIDAAEVRSLLAQNFDLSDLKVNGVSGPAGYGVNIQFAQNKVLSAGQSEVDAAKAALTNNPVLARQHAENAVNSVKQYLAETNLPDDPAQAVNQADLYLVEASKNISQKIQQLVIQRFSLGENIAFQWKEVSPTLSASFWQTGINVGIAAIILITIVIFIFFRKIVPSIAVISCGIFDVASAVALMAVFQIPLSLSSIPTLLMLLGYSIDTDIMLSSRMLHRKEKSAAERAYSSLGTGLTMTGTTIAAVTVMLVVSYFSQIGLIFEISAVLMFGLLGDMVGTWLMNAPILLWYVERTKKVHTNV